MELTNCQLLITLLVVALARASEAELIPITLSGLDSEWLVLESEQVVSSSSESLPQNVKWLVKEYVCLDDGIAYSIHTNTQTGQTYELLSWHSGKFYLKKSTESGEMECDVDHRHDYTSLFPWSHWWKSLKMSGVIAMWRNMLGQECTPLESSLHCAAARDHTEFSLDFDSKDYKPLFGEYLGRNVIWTDQATILDWVKQKVEVTRFRFQEGRPDEIKEALERRENSCRSLTHYQLSSLPKAMKIFTESETRAYRMKYRIVIPEGGQQSEGADGAATWHLVDEWFSFDHGMQTLSREVHRRPEGGPDESVGQHGERHKLIQLFDHNDGTSIGYEVEYSENGKEKGCKFSSVADDEILAQIAPFMKMQIKLAPNEPGTNTTIKRSVGQLIGFGAIMLYFSETQYTGRCGVKCIQEAVPPKKSLDYYGNPIEEDEDEGHDDYSELFEVKTRVIGVLMEIWDSARKIKFEFGRGSSSKIGDLKRAEIYQDDRLKAYIDSIEFKADVKFDEKLEHPFEIPHICPPLGELIVPVVEQPVDEPNEPSQLVAEDEFSFPSSGNWHAYLKENYKLSSKWSIGRTTGGELQYEVVEYLMIDSGNRLLGRIDLIQGGKIVSFVLAYGDDAQFRIESGHCALVDELEDWLRVGSAEMHLVGYHETGCDKPVRHFGLGGLWSLASRLQSLDLVDLTRDDHLSDEFLATWMLHDVAELPEGTSAKFRFTTRPDRELERLSLEAKEAASILRSVEIQSDGFSISVSDIRIEPNKATSDVFGLPPGCPPVNRAGKLKFASILDELRGGGGADSNIGPGEKLSELDFELGYELLWATQDKRVLLQVTETNLPQKQLRLCSMAFVDGETLEQTQLTFWTRTGAAPEIVLDYQFRGKTRVCSRAPRLEHLLQMEAHLEAIWGSSGGELAGLPLANLWHEFAMGLERSAKLYHAETRATDGDKLHTIWTLNDRKLPIGFLELETLPGADKSERLKSVSIEKSPGDDWNWDEIFMSFQLTRLGRVKDLEQVLARSEAPTGCRHAGPAGNFPSLSNYLTRGSRLWMRSEVTRLNAVSAHSTVPVDLSSEVHFLDEWLALDEAYRSRYMTDAAWLEESLVNFDQLIYPQTREYFDLTEANQCKTSPRDVSNGKATMSNGSAASFIGESLFHSEHKVGLFGPISLWLLAQEAKSRRILFDGEPAREGSLEPDPDYKLHFLGLFDELHFRDWLLTDRWLVMHETLGSFVMVFKPQEGALEATRPDRVQQVADGSPLDIRVINYRFVTQEDRFEEFDESLRIPAGFGCVRSQEAKTLLETRPRDQISFDETVPFEFYYEASLRLEPPDGGQPPVFHSGRVMICPERWTTMFTGPLRVSLNEEHRLSGRTSVTRRVVMRDFHSSSRSTVRLIDELSGRCQIEIDRSDPFGEPKVLELDFSGELISFSMSQLVEYFDSARNFELIREFESAKGGDEKVTSVVLEAKSEMLKLNERLAGPGSIVRTFVRDAKSREVGRRIYHESARVELMVYGKARLTLEVNRMHFIECLEVIAEVKAEECVDMQEGKRRFEMVFEPVDLSPPGDHSDPANHSLGSQLTLQEIQSNRRFLEHELQRVFLSPPARISVAQLGRIELTFADTNKLVARFSLLEPVSLLHEFDLLAGHTIDLDAAKGMEQVVVERRAADSKLRCAHLCESRPHSCLAFAHCTDRICTFLQVLDWPKLAAKSPGPSRGAATSLLEGKLVENSQCSTHFWSSSETYAERHYVDEIVDGVRGHIEGRRASNKFALKMKSSNGDKEKTRRRFVATELREQIQTVDGGEESRREERLSSELVILADGSDFDLASGMLKPTKTSTLEASSLANCFEACRSFGCQLASFCSDSKICSLVANLNEWAQFEALTTGGSHRAGREQCAIYSWDFTQHFELFDETREPSEFMWRETAASVVECAARCQLEPGCLSVDFCPGLTGACFGQRSHVSFDRSLLSTTMADKPVQAGGSGSRRCSHYSKFVLADFEPIAGTKFAEHNSIVFHDVDLEHCAAVCRREASCRSFEYCTKSTKWHNTCYTETRPLRSQADGANSTTSPEPVETVNLDECSIYVLKGTALNEMNATEKRDEPRESLRPSEEPERGESFRAIWLCLIASILGGLIGLARRKLSRDGAQSTTKPN